MNVNARKILVGLSFLLFSVILVGIFYLFSGAETAVGVAFAYVVGLSMIVLPCTLPLAFIIVPLSMGKSPKKGLLMALAFGLGLSITLSLYGLFVALVGNILGLDQAAARAGTFSKVLFIIGGSASFLFGLSELKLLKFSIPSYGGSYPDVIQKQKDYLKAFFLGLFLGNAGVGCPNPLFYVLLAYISTLGSLTQGWWLGFIHGIGRATPLIFLSILGILGTNMVSAIASKERIVKKISGWSLVFLGAFIIVSGTSHEWFEEGPVHVGWNKIVMSVAGDRIAERGEEVDTTEPEGEDHEDGSDFIPGTTLPSVFLLVLVAVPIVWHKVKSSRDTEAENEQQSD